MADRPAAAHLAPILRAVCKPPRQTVRRQRPRADQESYPCSELVGEAQVSARRTTAYLGADAGIGRPTHCDAAPGPVVALCNISFFRQSGRDDAAAGAASAPQPRTKASFTEKGWDSGSVLGHRHGRSSACEMHAAGPAEDGGESVVEEELSEPSGSPPTLAVAVTQAWCPQSCGLAGQTCSF